MRPVTFVGLSADGTAVIVADSGGTSYRLAIDDRLSAALGLTLRIGQMEIPLHALSPKDIQARIRAGATASELAIETGEPLERIERFAGPPLADRAHMAEQARTCPLRETGTTLGAFVAALSAGDGLDDESVRWDSWRREDGRWTVLAMIPRADGVERVATWIFDPASRSVTEDDASALATAGDAASLRLVPPVAEPAIEVVGAAPAETPLSADLVDAARPTPAEVPGESATEAPPAPASRGKGRRRASVPTWDEILFGATADADGKE